MASSSSSSGFDDSPTLTDRIFHPCEEVVTRETKGEERYSPVAPLLPVSPLLQPSCVLPQHNLPLSSSQFSHTQLLQAKSLIEDYKRARVEIENTYQFYKSVIEERRKELSLQLELEFKRKILDLDDGVGGVRPFPLIGSITQPPFHCNGFEFVNNYSAIEASVRSTFGSIRSGPERVGLYLGNLNKTVARLKMSYITKFGECGTGPGQFTEPSGIACDPDDRIIVADANSHRVQVFDQWGNFELEFGECGKWEGQLLYPNRVASGRGGAEIVVTERSPSHQIQVYDSRGKFLRKFGSDILGHPRALTVDPFGRIIVVECKVMRVLIFDDNGNVLFKFDCARKLEFPNGVAANAKREIFISDNRAHCVKVFNYSGQYLRTIGGPGVTNYPVGVIIDRNDLLLVGDNHNNFNLTVFTQEGALLGAYESKVKHAQCFDIAVLSDGSVAMASKDQKVYVYSFPTITRNSPF